MDNIQKVSGTEQKARLALDLIESAFSDRLPPEEITDSLQLSDVEYEEVMSFEGLHWQDVTFEQIEQNADAVFWFSPEAFCYYLAGILSAGLRENRCNTLAYDALVGTLDRSPEHEYWDDFFLPRWNLLNTCEIDAVLAWLDWLRTVQPDAYHSWTYGRAEDTLILLKLVEEEENRKT